MSNEAKNLELHTKCTCAAMEEMVGLYLAGASSAAEVHQHALLPFFTRNILLQVFMFVFEFHSVLFT